MTTARQRTHVLDFSHRLRLQSRIPRPLANSHYPLSTIHYPLSTLHSPLSTLHYPLTTDLMLTWLLSLVIFLPSVGAFVLCLASRQRPRRPPLLAGDDVVVFLLTVWLAVPDGDCGRPLRPAHRGRNAERGLPCVDSRLQYLLFLGVDGISLPLVLLTSFLSMLAMWASWPIAKNVRAYCILFLLLETGMLGVFMSLDFFLFYVFWEVMLLPMYFLIGIWGGPRREYAAIKFFLFTLVGSVLMLVAILMLYFASAAAACTCRSSVQSALARQIGPRSARLAVPSNADAGARSALLVGLPAAVDRLHHQAAGGAGPYLAARRPRRGADADLDDPGRACC